MSKIQKNNSSKLMKSIAKIPLNSQESDLASIRQYHLKHDEIRAVIANSAELRRSLADCTAVCMRKEIYKGDFLVNISSIKSGEEESERNIKTILESLLDVLGTNGIDHAAALTRFRFTSSVFKYCADSVVLSNPKLGNNLLSLVREYDSHRNALILPHMRLVNVIARGYVNRSASHDLEDLTSKGFEALIKAVDRFEHDRGASFSTFASDWIHHTVDRYIKQTAHIVSRPLYTSENRHNIELIERRYEDNLGRKPTLDELVAETRLSKYKVLAAQEKPSTFVSFDQPWTNSDSGASSPLSDIIEDEEVVPVDEQIALRETRELIDQLIRDTLDPREEMIIRLRFGFITGKEVWPTEMTQYVNYSPERIRQLAKEGVKLLAARKKCKELQDV